MNGKTTATRTMIACAGVFIFLASVSRLGAAFASVTSDQCLMCHSAKTLHKTAGLKTSSLYVDPERFGASVHGAKECVFCHADLKNQPLKHKAEVAPVECARCHEKKGWNPNTIHYGISDSPNSPTCQGCHGSHYMKPKTDPASEVNPANADAICAKCHAKSRVLRPYERGIHSDMGESGHPAAGCVDCHEPHSGQPANAPIICAKCHSRQFREYSHGSHGKALAQGNTDVPTCVKCHGAHDITAKDDPRSPIYPRNISAECGRCHDDARPMAAYDLPSDRLKTYRESYHGIANKYGDPAVATCASCHEAHDVLPSSDAASSTSRHNLPRTCGKCHHGMSAKVTQGKSHVVITHYDRDSLYWVSVGFKWLTIGAITALVGHIMLDLFSRIRIHARRTRR